MQVQLPRSIGVDALLLRLLLIHALCPCGVDRCQIGNAIRMFGGEVGGLRGVGFQVVKFPRLAARGVHDLPITGDEGLVSRRIEGEEVVCIALLTAKNGSERFAFHRKRLSLAELPRVFDARDIETGSHDVDDVS